MDSAPARYRLTVNATLAEWVAHFQVSSLQNYFCDFFTGIASRAASFWPALRRFGKEVFWEGEAPAEPPQEIAPN